MARASYFTRSPKAPSLSTASSDYSEVAARQAWEIYVAGETKKGAAPSVRDEILNSWKRSAKLGIDAGLVQTARIEKEEQLHEVRRSNNHLSKAARAAFSRLAPHLIEARAILILTDRDGVIIEAIGDNHVLENGREIGLEVGGIWTESAIGTNGIGTALKTGQPTYVHAAEHFCEGVQSWTCAGVPVFDPFDKSVVGVVDLSGPPDIFRRHNIALVVAAAREIEIALAEQQRKERTLLLETFVNSGARRPGTGVVLLDRVGRILFRQGVNDILVFPKTEMAVGSKLVSLSAGMTDQDIVNALPSDLETDGVDLLRNEGAICGAALFFKESSVSRKKTEHTLQIPARRGIEGDDLVIVGSAPKMLEAIELAERAAEAKVTVLIHGETGVGKELFARLIHCRLTRKDAPYVAVNCAAISGDLIGAELFGHVEGAFTGAVRGGKAGKFELSDGGLLCLDEIGDMPVELQPYLLRALEQQAIYRIGDSQRRAVDVQLVAMTNRNLREDIETGRFRRDLFYRIGTIVIDVPPLRDRGDDILHLIEHFNAKFAKRFSRPRLDFTQDATDTLLRYRWPGNVRELRNLIERLFLLNRSAEVLAADLPDEIHDPQKGLVLPGDGEKFDTEVNLENVEAMAIRRAMEAEKGNMTRVASMLGISRPTLYRKIKQYKIPR